jgi:hypothetical protein
MDRLTGSFGVFTKLALKEDPYQKTLIETINTAQEKVNLINNDFDGNYNLSLDYKKNMVIKYPLAGKITQKSSKKLANCVKNKNPSKNTTSISFNSYKGKSKSSFKTTFKNSNEIGTTVSPELITNIKKKVSFKENITNQFPINSLDKVGITHTNFNSTMNSVSSKSVGSKTKKKDTNTDLVSLNSCFFTSINNKEDIIKPSLNLKLTLNSNAELIKIHSNRTDINSSNDSELKSIKSPKLKNVNISSILKNSRKRNNLNDTSVLVFTNTKSTQMKTNSDSTKSLKTMKELPILTQGQQYDTNERKYTSDLPYYKPNHHYSQKFNFSGKSFSSLSISKDNSIINKRISDAYQGKVFYIFLIITDHIK